MTSYFSKPFLHHDIPPYVEKSDVTLKFEKDIGFTESLHSLLYFGPPHNKIVSSYSHVTTKVRIWSYETSECLKTIDNHFIVKDIIQLSDEVFLCCSNDQTLRSFNIVSYEQEKRFKMEDNRVYELLLLTDDLFAGRAHSKELLVWSYEKERILKKYYLGNIIQEVYRSLLLSKKHPNCFYISTCDKDETIKLVNYERDEVVKEFKSHVKSQRFPCLSLFINSKNEEILIACRTSRTIYSYNTSHPHFDTRIKISQIKKWENNKNYDYPDNLLTCCFCFNNKYLLCGGYSGQIRFFELQEPQSSIKIIKEKQHVGERKSISDILFLRDQQIMITGSCDGKIKVTRVGGLSMKNNSLYDISDRKDWWGT